MRAAEENLLDHTASWSCVPDVFRGEILEDDTKLKFRCQHHVELMLSYNFKCTALYTYIKAERRLVPIEQLRSALIVVYLVLCRQCHSLYVHTNMNIREARMH